MALPPATRSRAGSALRAAFLIAAIGLVSLNLRPAVVAVGPLAESIRADIGLSAVAIGLLTTLPVVCFGAFAAAGPRVARRLGLERAVLAALVLLLCGIALRLLSPTAALFAGSVIAGIGIAMPAMPWRSTGESRWPPGERLLWPPR